MFTCGRSVSRQLFATHAIGFHPTVSRRMTSELSRDLVVTLQLVTYFATSEIGSLCGPMDRLEVQLYDFLHM